METLQFLMIEQIKILNIISIERKKQTKNIVKIFFSSDEDQKMSISLDLITEMDSRVFISKIKQILLKL